MRDGWLGFVQDHKIPYKRGSGRNNIQIFCPKCGDQDTSKHLGLNLGDEDPKRNNSYGCWENPQHSGKDPVRLIQLLLKLDKEAASSIARRYFKNVIYDRNANKIDDKSPIAKPKEFNEFTFNDRMENQFLNYLETRGFDPEYAVKRFNLHWAIDGLYSYRIIIPVVKYGFWYTWTARSIIKEEKVRYKAALHTDAPFKPSDFLFDQENLDSGDLLIITEGPFDAIKIDTAFIAGVSATSLFGKQLTIKQLRSIRVLSKQFKNVVLSLDSDAAVTSAQIMNTLSRFDNCSILNVPPGVKDWGACSTEQIKEYLCSKLTSGELERQPIRD